MQSLWWPGDERSSDEQGSGEQGSGDPGKDDHESRTTYTTHHLEPHPRNGGHAVTEETVTHERDDAPVRLFSTRRRRVFAALATGASAALVLSACAPIFAIVDQLQQRASQGTTTAPADFDGNFATQELNWQPCYNGMQCAEAIAPLDWSDLEGATITLALVKQPALGGDPLGSLFVNPGGPGGSGTSYVAESIDYGIGKPLQQAYDVIGWDPRGVEGSSPVLCLDAADMDEYLFGLPSDLNLEPGSDEWIAVAQEETVAFAEACLERTGPLFGHVDTMSTVRDLDMLRSIVGDEQLNYLGYSYGTYIGARYADEFPERVGRLVLDGAIDPTVTESEMVREQTLGFEAALRAYVTDCLTRSDCPMSGSVDEALAQWGALLDAVDEAPIIASDGRALTSGTLLTAIITPLYAQSNWQLLDQLFTSVRAGDARVAFYLADFYYDREDGVYQNNSTEAFLAINCLDYPREGELDLDAMHANAAELAAIAPTIGRFQGYGEVFCASWPVVGVTDRQAVEAAGAAPILVVGTTGDPATPYRWAEALAEQLQSGVLVTLQGEGHTAYGNSTCIDAVVEDYFLTGAVPSVDPMCTV